MKNTYKKDFTAYTSFGIMFFILYIIQYTDILSADSQRGMPQFMLIGTVLAGMFWGDCIGAIFGVFFGTLVDAVAFDVICFNSIFMLLCGFFCGVLVDKFINNNFRSSIIVNSIAIVIYYFLKWAQVGFDRFLFKNSILRSAFLTLIFSIPLYGFMHLINRKRRNET